MNVDLQEMELGAALRRRLNQAAPDKGGWNAFFGFLDRSIPNANPYGNYAIRADGLSAWDGWPTSPRIEALRAAWLDAGNIDEQRQICIELQMQLWQDVPYIPMGEYWQSTAYRKDLLDRRAAADLHRAADAACSPAALQKPVCFASPPARSAVPRRPRASRRRL
jgi:peptide/nickel transport system substrate-binding protein